MNQEIRNKLRSVVTQCRKLLEESVSQELEGKYGIFAKKDHVTADPNATLIHLTEEEQTARKDILDHFGHIKARGFKPKDALDQLVREIAFTHLNRLCAYKMMEAREVYVNEHKFREAVSRGVDSNGVKFYLADHPEEERLFNTGHQDIAYRHFMDWLGGLLSEEIGVLFSPNDPANRLYPRQKTLDEVLDLLNNGGIRPEEADLREAWPTIWTQDETIGWVYQYFTPKELRDAARDPKQGGSQAPRNSYELAFRNQFFTPRYVVEFLTDNTLGRIWYEMRKGNTKLKDQCRYMVRRPAEIFLENGEQPSKDSAEGRNDLSQEELLKLPVPIPHRPKKDPRELKCLDPACGSGHFLLYCFDLLLTIYEEAYDDSEFGPVLKKDYPTLSDLMKAAPGLILAHNIHGIDIDLRCSQIAALAMWLRCQRAYQEMGLKRERPKITRSHFVCAEPMPGEEQMLKEFVTQLEPKLLGQLVEVVFDKMKLAGEVGSLLKIDEDIRDAVSNAKKQWIREVSQATDRKGQPLLFTQAEIDRIHQKPEQTSLFDVSDVSNEQFFERAEGEVIKALRQYAEKAQNGDRLQRRLFAEDAVRGFAFVDLCQKRFDVVLMNPPFGLGLKTRFDWLKKSYADSYVDFCSSFISRASELCVGKVGAITSRSILVTKKLARLRANLLVPRLELILDLGHPVMDGATVQACAYTIDAVDLSNSSSVFAIDRTGLTDKSQPMDGKVFELGTKSFLVHRGAFASLSQSRVLYALPPRILSLMQSKERLGGNVLIVRQGMTTFNDSRFLRLRTEVDTRQIGEGKEWEPLSKGGPFSFFYSDMPVLVHWNKDGEEIAQENFRVNGQTAQARQASVFYRRPGGTYTRRCKDFGVRMLPAGCIIGDKGRAVFPQGAFSSEFVIGLLNSRFINTLVHIQANAKQFDSGIVEGLPWKPFNHSAISAIEEVSRECILAARNIAMMDETDSVFSLLPSGDSLMSVAKDFQERVSHVERLLETSLERINREVDLCYGVDSLSLRSSLLSSQLGDDDSDSEESEESDGDETYSGNGDALPHAARLVISASIGTVLGRWDARAIAGGGKVLGPPALFESLPACSPAMVQGPDGLPAIEEPKDYPIRIDWDGIIPDDPDHANDIVRRVREVLELIWKDRADAIEKEACEILRVKVLRDYFRKPAKGGFWDDHIYRYSKSRRKAPIYWLLQSSKKNYALWLYYHRLDRDLLFKALVNYVEPKVRLETSRLETLRIQKTAAGDSGKEGKRLAKDVERQEDFISELQDFEDTLRRAANLHLEPDLNDGVVLNIAPLHELVPWKEAKNYWDELLEGKYEWSSIGKQLRQKGLVK